MLSLLYVPERELNIFLEFGWNFPGKSSKLDAYFEGKKEKIQILTQYLPRTHSS